jgi:hypothetical protein
MSSQEIKAEKFREMKIKGIKKYVEIQDEKGE